MVEILLAFFKSEGRRAGELMAEGPRGADASGAGVAAFCDGIGAMVTRSHESPFFDKFGSYVGDICGLACTHKVKLNEQLVTMAMAIKVLEGIVLSLQPDVELCSAAIPILLRAQAKHAIGLWLEP